MSSVTTVEETATNLETAAANDEEQLVTMIVDDQLFGIPILQVQDIVEATKITPVPLAPSAIAGVLNLRGRIVTVIDLRKLLGNFDELPWDSQMGVTVEYKGDLYTLLVDAIGDVRTLSRREFDSSPTTLEENVRQLCTGIYRLRGNLLVVLDVSRILINEVIEATPLITVAERAQRKDAATAASKNEDGKASQLSTRMTDLNAYENEGGSEDDGTTSASDDIKERKKANRSRKPITERWQTVLDERARQAGQVVYRMNEPDDETVENALEEKVVEDAKWDAELQAKLAEEQKAETPPVSDEPPVYNPYAKQGQDLNTPAEPEAPTPAPEVTFEPPLPEVTPVEPEAATPVEPEAAAEPAVPEVPSDEPAAPESIADATSPDDENDSGSVVGGWWNKLRGKSDSPADEATPETPNADENPAKAKEKTSSKTKVKSKAKSKSKSKSKKK